MYCRENIFINEPVIEAFPHQITKQVFHSG